METTEKLERVEHILRRNKCQTTARMGEEVIGCVWKNEGRWVWTLDTTAAQQEATR